MKISQLDLIMKKNSTLSLCCVTLLSWSNANREFASSLFLQLHAIYRHFIPAILIINDNRCCATSRDSLNNSTSKDFFRRRFATSLQQRFCLTTGLNQSKKKNNRTLTARAIKRWIGVEFCYIVVILRFTHLTKIMTIYRVSIMREREKINHGSKRPKISLVFSRMQCNSIVYRESAIGNYY